MTRPVLPAGWVADGDIRRRGGKSTTLYVRDGN